MRCAVCMAIGAQPTAAATVIHGYAVCEGHFPDLMVRFDTWWVTIDRLQGKR